MAAVLLLAAAADASAQAAVAQQATEPDALVPFHGVLDADALASNPGGMLYPAPGAVGLIAAVLTHAAIENGRQDSARRKLQEESDKVLDPYKDLLATFRLQDLQREALARRRAGAAPAGAGAAGAPPAQHLVGVKPSFAMTQDQKALVLDASIAVGDRPEPIEVRVVSQPLADADPQARWRGGDGAALRQESAFLLAHAIDLAMQDAAAAPAAPPPAARTIRYPQGGLEKIERATVVAAHCDRKVVRTLRGRLMSVPMAAGAAADPCDPALPGWR